MLGRIYTILFLLSVFFALFYQRRYLSRSSRELDAQLIAENSLLPIAKAKNPLSLSYEKGTLKSSLFGENATYFNDGHFEIQNRVLYQEYNSQHLLLAELKSQYVVGHVQNKDGSSLEHSGSLGANLQIKDLFLKDKVFFFAHKNRGETSDAHIDMIQKKIFSSEEIHSTGPDGTIHGIGFDYFFDSENFNLYQDVRGEYQR